MESYGSPLHGWPSGPASGSFFPGFPATPALYGLPPVPQQLPAGTQVNAEIAALLDLYQQELAEVNAAHSLLQEDQEKIAEMLAPFITADGRVVAPPDESLTLMKQGLDLRLLEFEEDCRRIQQTERRLQRKIEEVSLNYESAVLESQGFAESRLLHQVRDLYRVIELLQQELDELKFQRDLYADETKRLRGLCRYGNWIEDGYGAGYKSPRVKSPRSLHQQYSGSQAGLGGIHVSMRSQEKKEIPRRGGTPSDDTAKATKQRKADQVAEKQDDVQRAPSKEGFFSSIVTAIVGGREQSSSGKAAEEAKRASVSLETEQIEQKSSLPDADETAVDDRSRRSPEKSRRRVRKSSTSPGMPMETPTSSQEKGVKSSMRRSSLRRSSTSHEADDRVADSAPYSDRRPPSMPAGDSRDGAYDPLERSADRPSSFTEEPGGHKSSEVIAPPMRRRAAVSREDTTKRWTQQVERKQSGAFSRLLSRTLPTPVASPRVSPRSEEHIGLSRARSVAFFETQTSIPKEAQRELSKTRSFGSASVASSDARLFRQRTLRSPALSRASSIQGSPRAIPQSPPDLPTLDLSKIRT